ncbi:hypothetical protein NPIL_357851 [Nephila pilipes]|uniref:Uncharacterized protein n=1 Tax=Nephila pilipes TaxID=299642 RepID=A0A8X6NRV1_NEPPI|nr:hypothetical protein NPIL_357851 [Nephila pilipes]
MNLVHWVVYAKHKNLAEGDITKLMKFLAEEVEGAVTANNIKGLLVSEYSIKSPLENFNVRSKPVPTRAPQFPFLSFLRNYRTFASTLQLYDGHRRIQTEIKGYQQMFPVH